MLHAHLEAKCPLNEKLQSYHATSCAKVRSFPQLGELLNSIVDPQHHSAACLAFNKTFVEFGDLFLRCGCQCAWHVRQNAVGGGRNAFGGQQNVVHDDRQDALGGRQYAVGGQ